MRILHYSTWQEPCGIASYTQDLVGALERHGVENEVHAVNKEARRTMTVAEVRADLARFCEHARAFDLVHIQHEFSFFNDATNSLWRSLGSFERMLRQLHRLGKPTAVTFHTEPYFLAGLRTIAKTLVRDRANVRRDVVHYCNTRKWCRTLAGYFRGTGGLNRAIVHTRKSKRQFVECGFGSDNIEVVPLGLVERDRSRLAQNSALAKEKLGYPKDCVLLSLFGFVAAYKGPDIATRALEFLPPNHHLAIVGGPHPHANDLTLNSVLALTHDVPALRGRVRVTGFVPTEMLDTYHAATDICLAPYLNTDISGSSALTWALSSGKPVIASKIDSFLELQEQADCLLMCTQGAAYELAWHIERLVNDPAQQKALVSKALRYVEQNSWPQIGGRTRAVYEQMIARAPGSRSLPLQRPRTGAAPAARRIAA